jgi:hypothetical protein
VPDYCLAGPGKADNCTRAFHTPSSRLLRNIAKKLSRFSIPNNYVTERDILIGCHSIAKKGWKFWQPLTHPKIWPLKNFIEMEAALRQANRRIRVVLTGSATLCSRSRSNKFWVCVFRD